MRAPRFAGAALCAGVTLVAALLAGCAGSLLKTRLPVVTTYRLACAPCQPPSPPLARLDADLTILRPRVRAGLESDRIAVLHPDRRLDHYADAAWSGALPVVVQDLLLEAYRNAALFRSVDADVAPLAARYWLAVRVVDFQAEYAADAAPVAHVHLTAELGDSGAGGGRVLATFDADARRPAAVNRLGDVVAAFDAAANEALRALVEQTAPALRR